MQTDGYSAPQYISEERKAELERQGAAARAAGERRGTSYFPGVERNYWLRGYDNAPAIILADLGESLSSPPEDLQ